MGPQTSPEQQVSAKVQGCLSLRQALPVVDELPVLLLLEPEPLVVPLLELELLAELPAVDAVPPDAADPEVPPLVMAVLEPLVPLLAARGLEKQPTKPMRPASVHIGRKLGIEITPPGASLLRVATSRELQELLLRRRGLVNSQCPAYSTARLLFTPTSFGSFFSSPSSVGFCLACRPHS